MIKKIAVLTSGGDAPGMNAAIRAVVRTALHHNIEVMGVHRGYSGLLNGEMFPMNRSSVSDIIQRGGTILRTARCEEFKKEEVRKEAVKILQDNGVDALVVIGGDGSFTGAKLLSKLGVKTIGLPGTIDNDLTYTGHVQRGGSPSAFDRVLASRMGSKAIELLLEGKTSRVVGIRKNEIYDVDIDEALALDRTFDDKLFSISSEINS